MSNPKKIKTEHHNSWKEILSKSGKTYWFNESTGESTWEQPKSIDSSSKDDAIDFEKVWSNTYKRFYYFNKQTGEKKWEEIENIKEGDKDDIIQKIEIEHIENSVQDPDFPRLFILFRSLHL